MPMSASDGRFTACVVGACAMLIAVGCTAIPQSAGTLAGISLHVQPETARAVQPGMLRLAHEHAPERLGYNLCTAHLERRVADDWEAVPSDRICTMELRILEPDSSARYEYGLPAGLAPGEYRAVTVVHMLETDDRLEVASLPFRVE
jgi:hypothetical protein